MKKLSLIMAILIAAGVSFSQTLNVSPGKIQVAGTPFSGVTAAYLEIYNIGTGTSWYTVSVPSNATNWVTSGTATGSSTNEIDSVTLTFVTTGLAAGFYETDVTVTQTNAPIQVKTVPITMEIYNDENLGVAVGPSSMATVESGVAIGSRSARAVAIGANTIQIGGGVNSTAGTVGIRTWQLLDANGRLPGARLGATTATTNQAFINGAGTTSTFMIVNGVITAVTP